MAHYVYIMASRPGGALYTGRTTDLRARVETHRAGLSRHTARYNIRTLVWFEAHKEFEASLRRERAIKRWRRGWKDALITEFNPNWKDMAHAIPD
ncbi:MAG: GIY-YIG nuclease family protein [Dinoroseobacter sp.]|nr:GIY-YIG nuclease family protein [Dinoroseobacter sp.]